MHIRSLSSLSELGFRQDKPTVLFVDNKGAIELSKDLKSCQRSRHVERRYLKLRELVTSGDIEVKYVPTEDNPADVMTKSSLSVASFAKHTKTNMNL